MDKCLVTIGKIKERGVNVLTKNDVNVTG